MPDLVGGQVVDELERGEGDREVEDGRLEGGHLEVAQRRVRNGEVDRVLGQQQLVTNVRPYVRVRACGDARVPCECVCVCHVNHTVGLLFFVPVPL